jgi:hypothetical protein
MAEARARYAAWSGVSRRDMPEARDSFDETAAAERWENVHGDEPFVSEDFEGDVEVRPEWSSAARAPRAPGPSAPAPVVPAPRPAVWVPPPPTPPREGLVDALLERVRSAPPKPPPPPPPPPDPRIGKRAMCRSGRIGDTFAPQVGVIVAWDGPLARVRFVWGERMFSAAEIELLP